MNLNLGKIWIVGAYGRVGSAISNLLDLRKVELLKTDIDDVDITNPRDVNSYADRNRPDVIINCAGMTNVALCEKEIERAFKVNALGARNLSVAAKKIRARLVQLSTDDVFDGKSNTPYNEFDSTNPNSIYGKSKLAGENFVKELSPKHIIIRSSWVYGEGSNFVKDILELSKTNDTIEVSSHQFASPTSANELAKVVIRLLQYQEDGIYHAVCQGTCSRYEFAQEILRLAHKKVTLISTEQDSIHSNLRPSYSVLDNLMLRMCEIETPIPWQDALKEYMEKNFLLSV